MFHQTAKFFEKSISDDVVARLSTNARTFLKRQEAVLEFLSGGNIERIPEIDPRDLLRRHLKNLNLKVDRKVFFRLGADDNFEIWSLDYNFLGTGNQLIKRLSYSLDELLTCDWAELFDRDPQGNAAINAGIERLKQGAAMVDDVAPHHRVTERRAAQSSALVQVKSVALAYDADTGVPCAMIAITNIKDYIAS